MASKQPMEILKVFGEKYFLRKTFDILDYYGGVYGFDTFNEDGIFLFHYDGEDEKDLISEIKWNIYRNPL